MLEKALDVIEERIKTPQDLYKALHHKSHGLGSIVTPKHGHPLAHKALKLDHKKQTAEVDEKSLEHLEKLSAAFLHEAEHDNIIIKKSNHRYAFTHALWLMHHDRALLKLPEDDVRQMQSKIEAIETQIGRFQSYQDNLHGNNENEVYVRLKTALTQKRIHLMDMKASLNARANTLERELTEEAHALTHKSSTEPHKPEDNSDASTSPSTSGSDTLYINIKTPSELPHPAASPPSIQLSASDAASPPPAEELQSSSGEMSSPPYSGSGDMSSPPSAHSPHIDYYATPSQSQAPTPLSTVRGLTGAPHPLYQPTTPQRSPAFDTRGVSSPLLHSTTITSSPSQQRRDKPELTIIYGMRESGQEKLDNPVERCISPPLPPDPADLVRVILSEMVAATQGNLSMAKELQKQYFVSWVSTQNRATLIYLSNYMQDVQDDVIEEPCFKVIRRDFFSRNGNGNTQDWVNLRHAVKIRIIAIEKERAPQALVDGEYKFVVDHKSDLENRHHLGKHSGRFFTRWGKTACLTLYEEEFVSSLRVPRQTV